MANSDHSNTRQMRLFDAWRQLPRDPNRIRTEDPRLSKQCREILQMLRDRETVTNTELATISLKYTSRISGLRAAGFTIEVVKEDCRSGVRWYRLVE